MSAYPPRFETLDSLAVATGRQYSAHTAKTLEHMRLRLRRKEQGLLCVGWAKGAKYFPGVTYSDDWIRLVDPIVVPKARVVVAGLATLTYDATDEWLLQVVTRARPVRIYGSGATGLGFAVAGASGPGDDATGLIDLSLLAGPEEEISVYGRVRNGTADLTLFGLTVTGLRQTDF